MELEKQTLYCRTVAARFRDLQRTLKSEEQEEKQKKNNRGKNNDRKQEHNKNVTSAPRFPVPLKYFHVWRKSKRTPGTRQVLKGSSRAFGVLESEEEDDDEDFDEVHNNNNNNKNKKKKEAGKVQRKYTRSSVSEVLQDSSRAFNVLKSEE